MIPTLRSRNDGSAIAAVIAPTFWISLIAFGFAVLVLLLTGRLGFPAFYVQIVLVLGVTISSIAVGWLGRTMTSSHYFFADRSVPSAVTGFSSVSDFAGAAFLLTYAASPSGHQIILLPALMFGMVIMAAMVAGPFRRADVATLAGFFSWRYGGWHVGTLAVFITSVATLLICLAEFTVVRSVIELLLSSEPGAATWFVLIIVVIPPLLGGWRAMVFTSLVLTVWMLVALIIPTAALSLLPEFLQQASLLENVTIVPITTAIPIFDGAFNELFDADSFWAGPIALTVLMCGFAVLPTALSRVSLVKSPVASMEHLGWAALSVFIVVICAPLTLVLITKGEVANASLAPMLAAQPLLQALPYIALVLVGMNALSATLYVVATTIVRGIQRARRINPNERTMFASRVLVIVLGLGVGLAIDQVNLSVAHLLSIALAFLAATLFVPIVASIWLKVPSWSIGVAMLLSMCVFIGIQALNFQSTNTLPDPFASGILAMAVSTITIGIAAIGVRLNKLKLVDDRIHLLRGQSR